MEFKDIVMSRYAVKLFDEKKVPDEKVEELKDIIRYAPSSYNVQSWKIIVVEDEELRKELFPATYNQKQIITCSHLLVFCADIDIEKIVDSTKERMIKEGIKKESAENYASTVKNSVRNFSPEEKTNYAKRQVFLALGNAVNGAKSLGFDSCPMGGFSAEQYSEILDLPENIIPLALCPIGYAADEPSKKIRLSKEEVFIKKGRKNK